MYINDAWLNELKNSQVVLFGASERGKQVLEFLKSNDILVKYFCDNDEKKMNSKLEGIEIISPEKLKSLERFQNIVISSQYWHEILDELEKMGFSNIYIESNGNIEKLFVRVNNEITNQNVKLEKDIFKYTNRISIELSNMCNYATIHKKCPLNLENTHSTLSSKIVYKIFEELKKYNFNGTIAFHTYNEPLIDPRLFMFIKEAKEKCPDVGVYILTNGYYFNQIIADELIEIGVSHLEVTAYSKEEYERLKKVKINIPYRIFDGNLDDRLDLYNNDKTCANNKPCYAPLNEIIVKHNGNINLCCLDWKQQHCFGNLYEQSFEEIVLKSEMLKVYEYLSKGEKKINICRCCKWIR